MEVSLPGAVSSRAIVRGAGGTARASKNSTTSWLALGMGNAMLGRRPTQYAQFKVTNVALYDQNKNLIKTLDTFGWSDISGGTRFTFRDTSTDSYAVAYMLLLGQQITSGSPYYPLAAATVSPTVAKVSNVFFYVIWDVSLSLSSGAAYQGFTADAVPLFLNMLRTGDSAFSFTPKLYVYKPDGSLAKSLNTYSTDLQIDTTNKRYDAIYSAVDDTTDTYDIQRVVVGFLDTTVSPPQDKGLFNIPLSTAVSKPASPSEIKAVVHIGYDIQDLNQYSAAPSTYPY